jgi:hypothetical protein
MSNIIQEEIEKIRKMMLLEELVQEDGAKKLKQTLDILKKKKKVLLLSCSNRFNWDPKKIDVPKSKLIAMYLNEELGDKSVFMDVSELKIFPCEDLRTIDQLWVHYSNSKFGFSIVLVRA